MTEETKQIVYAKIHEEDYIEFPVYLENIRARNQKVEDYQEVIFGRKPEVPPFHSLQSDLYIYDGKVRHDYKIAPISLTTLLNLANNSNSGNNEPGEDVYFSSIDPELAGRIYFLIQEHIANKLEAFVQTKSYSSVVSCVSYIDDINPEYDSDARKVKALRSLLWTTVNAYAASITNNTIPVPKSLAEIESNIPPLTWD